MSIYQTAAAALLCLAGTRAVWAQEQTLVAIPGTCEIVTVGGRASACANNAQVIYAALPNGRVMYNVALADGRILAFVGEKDEQPRPEEYRLFLSHVRTGPRTNPQASIAAGANGVCETTQTRDASVVYRLSCTAMDEGGRKFALEFVGDGRRVSFPRQGGGR